MTTYTGAICAHCHKEIEFRGHWTVGFQWIHRWSSSVWCDGETVGSDGTHKAEPKGMAA